MNRWVTIYILFILCLSLSFALQVTITADFNNTKNVARLGTLNWFIEPTNVGEAINVTGYCTEGEAASEITIPQKQQNGQPGTVRKTCTVTNTELLKQYSPFYTYATFSYMQPETIDGSPKIVYYTFPTPKSKMFGFNNFIEDAVSKSFDWLKSIFVVKKTCDKDPSVCTVGDFCYLTDQATTDLNTVEKMNQRLNDDPTLKARIKQTFLIIDESPDGQKLGCLPKSLREYFNAMKVQSAENIPSIYDTGAYVTYDKENDRYNVLIYSHVKRANSLLCTMSFSLGDQTLSQARVYQGFVSDLIYDSKFFSIPEPKGDVAFNAILTCDGVQKDTSSGFVKTKFFTDAKGLVRAESGNDAVLTVKSVECGPACDGGILDFCTREKCYETEKCVYEYATNLIGSEDGTCKSCTEKDSEVNACGDYGTEEGNCNKDPCKIGSCSFMDGKCISVKAKKPFKVVIVPIIGDEDIVFETDLGGGYKYMEGYKVPQIPGQISKDEIEYAVHYMPCELKWDVVPLEAKNIPRESVSSKEDIADVVHAYVKESNINDYAMILVVFGDNIQTMDTQSNEVHNILGMMVGGDSYFVPGTVNGGDLLHEWGHKFGKLCDEGYYIFSISKSSCESGYATGMFKGYGGCDQTPEYDCCPNIPETDSSGQGSIMCSADDCGTGCVHGYFFTESGSKAVKKALENEGYCT